MSEWQAHVNAKDDDVLRFSNLKILYNYRHVAKSFEIGVISSFGLLG